MSQFCKALMNIFLSRKFISEAELKSMVNKLRRFHEELEYENVDEALDQMDYQCIESLGLVIKKIVSEKDGLLYYVICNVFDDDLSRMATTFSLVEVEFFKLLIDSVIESEHNRISIDQIFRIEMKNFPNEKKKEFLLELLKSGWMSETEEECYSLGIRTLLELKQYLNAKFEGILYRCAFCSEVVMCGELCRTKDCRTKIHKHCIQRWYVSSLNDQLKCPNCRTEWQSPH